MAFWSSANLQPARQYRFKLGPAGVNWWYANSVDLPSFDVDTTELLLVNQKFKYPGVATWNDVVINVVDVEDSVDQIQKTLATRGFDSGVQINGLSKVLNPSVRDAALKKIEEAATEEMAKFEKEVGDEKREEGANRNVFSNEQDKKIKDKKAEIDEAKRLKIAGLDADMAQANNIIIEQLTDKGTTLRKWILVNSYVSGVNYGKLDYSVDDLVSIDITITYDYATIEKTATNAQKK